MADYSGKNLQGQSFKDQNFKNANFSGADLRGANFSNANLENADFSKAITGMKIQHSILLFLISLLISLLSGYIATLVGITVKSMILSAETTMQISGYLTLGYFTVFIGFAFWKGLFKAIKKVFLIMILLSVLLGLFGFFTGLGSGVGALKGVLSLVMITLMFLVGTISRASAGTLASNILFLLVGVAGSVFGRSVGGGLGTVVLAIACAVISKRALDDTNKSSILRKIALNVGAWFGTSFKGANLSNANFSEALIKNTNFSNAQLSGVNWSNTKKLFTIEDEN